ncbi:hypothetical protein J4423_00035 [Candidatus Pacearchaeota archaeon]|nr:hypothetical protein [Candidatus Pacearchaeota archaeon]
MTQKFRLDGNYKGSGLNNRGGKLEGEIEIADNLSFEGLVNDFGAETRKYVVQGHFRSEDGFDKMWFVKHPPKESRTNVAFYLRKESDGSLDGKYLGLWSTLPHKIEYSADYELFIARIDVAVCAIRDSAEINLHKI